MAASQLTRNLCTQPKRLAHHKPSAPVRKDAGRTLMVFSMTWLQKALSATSPPIRMHLRMAKDPRVVTWHVAVCCVAVCGGVAGTLRGLDMLCCGRTSKGPANVTNTN